jgi:hypothetical protein
VAGTQRHPAIAFAVVVALAMTGCGGGAHDRNAREATTSTSAQAPTPRSTPSTWHSSLSFRRDKSRTAVGIGPDQRVCGLLRPEEVTRELGAVNGRAPHLHAAENDSFQLSICRYSGRGAVVRVVLDGATDATRRFFNMSTEATEIPKLVGGGRKDFRLVRGVGDDDTYGGAGAYWQPSSHRLVSIHDDRIVRVVVTAVGSTDRRRRVVASRLARRVLLRASR